MINRFCEAILEYIGDRMAVVVVFGALGVAGLIGFLIYMAVSESKSPTIELRKTEWECTGTRSEPTTTYIQSGKVMVPITTYHDVCVQYNRR